MGMSAEYALLLLAKEPETQRRVYAELSEALARHERSEFSFQLLNELHVFRAYVYEALRISCVAVSGIPHWTTKRYEVGAAANRVAIPKGAVVYSNQFHHHRFVDWNSGQPLHKANEA